MSFLCYDAYKNLSENVIGCRNKYTALFVPIEKTRDILEHADIVSGIGEFKSLSEKKQRKDNNCKTM